MNVLFKIKDICKSINIKTSRVERAHVLSVMESEHRSAAVIILMHR